MDYSDDKGEDICMLAEYNGVKSIGLTCGCDENFIIQKNWTRVKLQ